MAVVSKLQIVLEATTTAFDRGLKQASENLNAFAKKNEEIHNRLERFNRKHEQALSTMRGIGAASAAAMAAVGYGIKSSVNEAIKFESALAEVKKVVDFDSPEGLVNMRRELENLSTQVPIAFDGLAKIAAAAGQSGIAADEIVKFTEAAAKMGTAFDISAEEAGQAMAEMRTAFKMSQLEVETLADKINYLGNNSPNAAAKIMQVVQTIGPLGEIAGVSSDQIAAMAASLTGVKPDVAATGLKNMMIQLTKGDSLAKSAKTAFTQLGLSYTNVAKGMQKDSVGTINKVLEAIKKLPAEAQTASINAIFGAEALPVVSQLVTGTETLTKHLQAMGDATKYAGSMNAEAANINATAAAQMEMFKNATQNAKAAIGEAFIPALAGIVEKLTPTINSIKEFAQENPKLISTIAEVTGVILSLGTALGAIGLAVPVVTTAFGGLAAISGLVGAALGAVTFPILAIGVAITGVIVAGVALYKNWETVKAKAAEIFNSLPAPIKTAIDNIKSYFSSMKAVFDVVLDTAKAFWHGFSTIPLAAFEVIKASVSFGMNAILSIIKAVLTGIAAAFNFGFDIAKAIVETALGVIKGIINGDMNAVVNAIKNGLKTAGNAFNQLRTDVVNTIKQLGTDLYQAGKDAVDGLVKGINDKISAAVAKSKELASGVKNAVTNFFDIRSPSRVMMQVGYWIADGLAVGIKKGAAKTKKEAKKMAEDIKKATDDERINIAKSVYKLQQELKGNPYADFLTDIAFGKYGDAKKFLKSKDYTQISQLKEAEKRLQNIISINDELDGLRESVRSFGMDEIERLEHAYKTSQKYYSATEDDMLEHIGLLKEIQNLEFGNKIDEIREQRNLIGKTEVEQLEYKLKYYREYRHISDVLKKAMIDEIKLKEFETLQSEKKLDLEKKLHMLRGGTETSWLLKQSQFTEEQKKQIEQLTKQIELTEQLAELREKLKDKSVFDVKDAVKSGSFGEGLGGVLEGIAGLGNINAGAIENYAKIEEVFAEEKTKLKQAYEDGLILESEYYEQSKILAEQYADAKEKLLLNATQSTLGGITAITKSAFGEQSKLYRTILAFEKGVAISRSIIAIKTAMAMASANPFPANLGAMATIASQTANIISAIKSVVMPVGQAHDGIMSVPKSGTWNLEKGERVLPRHTAKALDDKLDKIGTGDRPVNVVINNYSGEKTDVQQMPNGDMMVTIGKMISHTVDAKLNQRFIQARRQGGELYGR